MWAYNDVSKEGGWYRCPMCTELYAPWKDMKSKTIAYIKANMLMVMDASGPIPDILGGRSMGVAASGGTPKGPTTIFVPFVWPDTKTATLTNRLKEVAAEITADIVDNNLGAATLIERVSAKVEEKVRQKTYWKTVTMPASSVEYFKWLNQQGANREKPFLYDHLLEPWLASQYLMKDDEPVLSETDLLRMVLYTRLAVLGSTSGS